MKITIIFIALCFCACAADANKQRWDADKSEWSELMLSIYDNDVPKFLSLLRKGADVNFITPGKKGFSLTALEVAIRRNSEVAVAELLATDKIKNPAAMMRIAAAQSSGKNVELIIKYGGNPNDTIANGFSVLMTAANSGSKEVVEVLLNNGADPNQFRRPDRFNSLMLAVLSGNKDKVKTLLDHGADKTMRNSQGHTPLDLIEHIRNSAAITNDDKEELEALLR
jgi:ankyrin repeat protein